MTNLLFFIFISIVAVIFIVKTLKDQHNELVKSNKKAIKRKDIAMFIVFIIWLLNLLVLIIK